MTSEIKVDDPPFQCQLSVSHDECVVQIWWLQQKYVMSYHADSVQFTDGQTFGKMGGWTDRQTDAQTQATTIPLWPEKSWDKKLGANRQRGQPNEK